MSLVNSYERLIAKNLLLPGAGNAIPTKTELYIGLITSIGYGVGPSGAASTAITNATVNFDELVVFNGTAWVPSGGTSGVPGIEISSVWYPIYAFEVGYGVANDAGISCNLGDGVGATPTISGLHIRPETCYCRIPLNVAGLGDFVVDAVDKTGSSLTASLAYDSAEIDMYTGGGSATSLTGGLATIANKNAIKYPTAKTAPWGDVVGWFITTSKVLQHRSDANTTAQAATFADSCFVYGGLNTQVPIATQDRPIFNSGALAFTIL